MIRKLVTAVAALVVGAGLFTVAIPAQAAPSPHHAPHAIQRVTPGPTYLTMAQAEAREINQYVGPNVATAQGRYHIIGFKPTNSSGYAGTMYTLTNGANPTLVSRPGSSPQSPTMAYGSIWYEPWTWDWGSLMGQAWDAVWNYCMKGALTGVVGTAGTTVMTNLLARGGTLVIGWEGYAAVAFGGCLATAVVGP